MICIGKHNMNGFRASNRCISLTKINTFNLCVALSNKTSFITNDNAIFILLVAKNSLSANDIMLRCVRSIN